MIGEESPGPLAGPRRWAWPELVLGTVGATSLAAAIATLGSSSALDPNEPWNAHFASLAVAGGSLYGPSEAGFFNNYPPLSFYLVGAAGKLFGNPLFAGRWISLLAFVALCVGVVFCARAMGSGWRTALFSALVLIASIALFSGYVGMDDPQLLGHAVTIAGFLLVVRQPRNTGAIAGGALLLTLALFIKHNLLAQPIALFLWLALMDRRAAAKFALAGITAAALGLALCLYLYGFEFLAHLGVARVWSLDHAMRAVTGWLGRVPLSAAIAAALFWSSGSDRMVRLCAIYAGAAIVLGTGFGAAQGVAQNIMFDADIALALSASLALERAGQLPWPNKRRPEHPADTVAALYVLSMLLGLAINGPTAWHAVVARLI